VEFDRTRIVIRQRSIWEILDLSLRVARLYAKPLLVSLLILAAPLALMNGFLLHWVVADEYSGGTVARHVWLMLLLVFLQAPIATLPTTALLGRAMFIEDLSWRSIRADLRQVLPGVFWTQGMVRGGWLLVILMASLRPSLDVSAAETWLVLLAAYSLLLRMSRPYINEIVLLERQPVRKQAYSPITIGRRSRGLHRRNTGDLTTRWIIAASATVMLTLSLVLSIWFVVGALTNDWRWNWLIVEGVVPLVFWLAAGYTTIVKFINYLDLRIRGEGWEVELHVRAAAQRLPAHGETSEPRVARTAKQVLTVALLVLVCWPAARSASAADDGVEASRRALQRAARFPWYDSQTDEVRSIVLPEQSPLRQSSDWEWKASTSSKPRSDWWEWFWRLVQLLVWIGLAILLVLLVYFWLRVAGRRDALDRSGHEGQEDDRRHEADSIQQLPFQVKPPHTDLLSEARRYYQLQDYRQAIIYLFGYQLVQLDRHQHIRLAKGKTNRQYLHEVRAVPSLRQLLSDTMLVFEDVFFGHYDLDRERFETCWGRLPTFDQLVQQPSAPTH
jgi:hypothetical protein